MQSPWRRGCASNNKFAHNSMHKCKWKGAETHINGWTHLSPDGHINTCGPSSTDPPAGVEEELWTKTKSCLDWVRWRVSVWNYGTISIVPCYWPQSPGGRTDGREGWRGILSLSLSLHVLLSLRCCLVLMWCDMWRANMYQEDRRTGNNGMALGIR